VSEKMFSREQYEQLRSFPEISRDELFRYFTWTPADVAFVDLGAGRGPADRLGMAVVVSALPVLPGAAFHVAGPGHVAGDAVAGHEGADAAVVALIPVPPHEGGGIAAAEAAAPGWRDSSAKP
jgi:hypothetical protein